jgi:hypothetical protein
MNLVRLRQSRVLESLVTVRTNRAQISGHVLTAFGFVDDVPHGQANLPGGAERIGIPCAHAAHLASVAIAFENEGAGFFGNAAREGGNPLIGFEQVLAGFQIGTSSSKPNSHSSQIIHVSGQS